MSVEAVAAPDEGVWRVGRAPDPLATTEPLSPSLLDKKSTGNRFDSPTGAYRALYFASTLDGCYGETLARFRPDPRILELVEGEWAELGFMRVGDVPADWRQRRIAVHVTFPAEGRFTEGVQFLDVESLETRQALREELAPTLAFYGYEDLDIPTVRGGDRRVTRWIGQWAYEQTTDAGSPRFAGIRYVSRLNSQWECWAVFDDVSIVEINRRPILPSDEAFLRCAKQYRLIPH